MFKNEGGVKGRLNNVKKNRQFGTGEGPLRGRHPITLKMHFND